MKPSKLHVDNKPMRISFIIEWANTAYNGVPRFWGLINLLSKQWQDILAQTYPENLQAEEIEFLKCLNNRPEVLIVASEEMEPYLEEIHLRMDRFFDVHVIVKEGLEYYALKNFGASLATGDIYCFLDSDVHPDAGWLAHLLGCFSRSDIQTVMGQPYIKPLDVFSRAFALGWTYQLADDSGRIFPTPKIYANNIAFRAKIFRRVNFPILNRRTRGAASILKSELEAQGVIVWENRKARVDHPPPSSFYHMVIRALAHGRDGYMKCSEERSLDGLLMSQKIAGQRLLRGYCRTFSNWQKVGAKNHEIPGILAIITCYYFFWSLGGLFTHISPESMGRRCRL